MKLCAKIQVVIHIMIKPTKGTLILFSRCIFSFPLFTVAMASHSWGAIACYKQDVRGKQVGWLSEMILYLDKLGQIIQMNFVINFLLILINCDFYWNRRNSGLVLYLKLLVLVTTMSVANFMLVSKSAQFTLNFLLSRRTINTAAANFVDNRMP